jgi:hypothetical protein
VYALNAGFTKDARPSRRLHKLKNNHIFFNIISDI